MLRTLSALTLAAALVTVAAPAASAGTALDGPCRSDSWHWAGKNVTSGKTAMKRVLKQAGQPRPTVTATFPVNKWTPVTGKACDAAKARMRAGQ